MNASRRFILFTILALVVAACTTAATGPSEEQVQAVNALADQVAQLTDSVAEISTDFDSLAATVDQAESSVSGFLSSAQAHAIDRTATIPEPPEGQVAVRISFAYLPGALPGDGVQSYRPLPDVSTVWAMESLPAGAELPVGDLIEGQTVFITPGDTVAVTLAYENPTEDAVQFMAVPHQDSPGSLNAMIWPQCLCFSFPYEAPAGGAWYRVIELTASPEIPPGSKVDILWTLLTDQSVFPEN